MGQFTVTFPATGGAATGGTRSVKFNIEKASLMAIQTPTDWTAAVVSLMSRVDRGTATGSFFPVHRDDGSEYTMTIAANRVVSVDLASLAVASLGEIKLRSGTATAEVSQVLPRTFFVRTKP